MQVALFCWQEILWNAAKSYFSGKRVQGKNQRESDYSNQKESRREKQQLVVYLIGVRLAISFPEIYEMQVRAICEATAELMEERVSNIKPQIMVPQVGIVEEILNS